MAEFTEIIPEVTEIILGIDETRINQIASEKDAILLADRGFFSQRGRFEIAMRETYQGILKEFDEKIISDDSDDSKALTDYPAEPIAKLDEGETDEDDFTAEIKAATAQIARNNWVTIASSALIDSSEDEDESEVEAITESSVEKDEAMESKFVFRK